MRTVAMMYVSAVNLSGNCGQDLSSAVVHLNCVYSPDDTKEEHSFWKASPSGNAKIRFRDAKDAEKFKPGRKFKVWFVRNDESGDFTLIEHTRGGSVGGYDRIQIRVQQQKPETYEWTEITMDIDNKEAFPAFESLDGSPVRFNVTFMPTEITEGP